MAYLMQSPTGPTEGFRATLIAQTSGNSHISSVTLSLGKTINFNGFKLICF